MRWMEERIVNRSRWAYAFRTLQEAGVVLSFGSDWPGTNASWYPANPILWIYAAVTRQTLDGQPSSGWFPEERVDVVVLDRDPFATPAEKLQEISVRLTIVGGQVVHRAG